MPARPDEIPGIPHRFERPEWLLEALTHRSLDARNYERLEFLGDSVLALVVSRRLFEVRPGDDEGSLSRLRSRVVRQETLARVARDIGLGEHMRLGRDQLHTGGHRRASILSDVLEAIIGAVYMDAGFDAAERVVRAIFDPVIDALPDGEDLKDPKTRLQEWLQARGRPLPEYTLVGEEGADHAKLFHVRCRLPDSGFDASASGRSRRGAEQTAARQVLDECEGAS
ncbi:ribonuclease III [Marinihelvus fidelis]|uniref:Ribonuclease 3 n=1 Tax=Marinihelvus fidelis TaxID=2613842 RepID=A0A5N0TDV0_9GAMM|nr:ribonuclease III [Marinihelvus fidelis]KAA9133273.1 ribonuclease III [Marinihelvus fidelis]